MGSHLTRRESQASEGAPALAADPNSAWRLTYLSVPKEDSMKRLLLLALLVLSLPARAENGTRYLVICPDAMRAAIDQKLRQKLQRLDQRKARAPT